mmetsp:Transcript_12811/g.38339  ORF Transcript_12811/g.38339 Transcript_12811/m.38339 type:complete len:275 (-) Transcript_12811:231-1055(-)
MQALQGDAQGRIITAPQTSPGAQQARRGYGRDVVRGRLDILPDRSLHGPQMCADVMDIYSWISGNRVAVNPEACTKSAFAAATYCVLRGADGFGRSCPQEQALTGFKILPYNEANGPEKVFLAPTCPARLSSSRRNPSADRRGRTAARRSRRCRRCRSIALQGQGVAAPRSQSARRAAAPGCRGAPSGSGRSTCDRSPASPPTAAAPCRCPCRALRPRRRPARCKPRQAAGCGCHIGPAWDEPPPARSRAACHPLPRRSHTSADALGGVGSSAA